ncbi:ferredoxin [Streptomyces sp. NRRL F-5755]|uniref:ferredoxin n=1 Tax=Streptomyces sp. NRRL F-5755 TaxID=1519475 RepID=UPI0006AF88D1|nr:ferredoxin [Streptomyces sp. NRRL F-5755]KOT87190.1 ferredoxin [Streptomyces sp. NRRL F-5755]
MRVEKNHDRCIGAGQCVRTEPKIFDQDDDGLVRVLVDRLQRADEAAARKAVFICPSKALSLVEE